VALLLHGLAGCHQSSYMVRIAGKLNEAGVRTFRMDLRGCGAGQGLASLPYHAGRSEDARAALEFLAAECPDSAATVVGFSLSGNIVLKLLGEAPHALPPNVEKAVTVSPALDLAACAGSLVTRFQKLYERHFVRLLCRQIDLNRKLRPEMVAVETPHKSRTLFEFDDAYTGPACGFGTAENYYATNSASRHLSGIRLPTLIISAKDDPLVPNSCFGAAEVPACVRLHVTEHGGHLGYVARPGPDPDRRWMDWRIVDWTLAGA
jgi:predicted alpha/beta-fold hydrolase